MDRYLLYCKSNYGSRRYVFGIREGDYKPQFTPDPSKAQQMDLMSCRKVDESTGLFLQELAWTPALQEELEEQYSRTSRIVHYTLSSIRADEPSVRTVCGHVIHKDSVSERFKDVTCDTCVKYAHGKKPSGRDIPRGYWPIKGKYFGQDIRTLPAHYWCWVMDKTDMVKEGSYLHDFFSKNEKTLRRRSGKKSKR